MHSFSKELQQIHDIEESGSYIVQVAQYGHRLSAVIQLVKKDLLKGLKSVIVIECSKKLELQNLLNESYFSDFTVEIDNDTIAEKDWYRIKAIAKSKLVRRDKLAFEISEYKYSKSKENLIGQLKNYGEPIFGSKAYRAMLNISIRANKTFSSDYIKYRLSFKGFVFSNDEFWDLKDNLEEALTLFKPHFLSLPDQYLISNDASVLLVEAEDIRNIYNTLEILKDKALLIQKEYLKFRKHFYNFTKLEISSTFIEVEKKIRLLINDIEIDNISFTNEKDDSTKLFRRSKSKSNFKNFNTTYKSIVQLLEDQSMLNANQLTTLKVTKTTQSELLILIELLMDYCNDKKESLDSYIDECYIRLNTQNSNFVAPLELSESLDTYIVELNELPIWDSKFENNSLSLNQQYKSLDAIVKKIVVTQTFIQKYPDFIFWNAFVTQQSDKFVALLNVLVHLEEPNWLNAFVSWYTNEIIERHNIDITNNNSLFDQYKEDRIIFNNEKELQSINILHEEQIDVLKNLKRNNGKLYNDLFKRTTPTSVPYSRLSNDSNIFFQILFPITIFYTDSVIDKLTLNLEKWDVVHICNSIEDHQESSIKTSAYTNRTLTYSRPSDDFQKSIFDFKLEYNYNSFLDFQELTSTQQLEPAQELAKRLINSSNKEEMRLLVGEYSYIVSFVNLENLNNSISTLGLKHIKTYDNSGNLLNNLTDIILVNEPSINRYLIIDMNLININDLSSLDYQLELIELMQNIGFVLLDINDVCFQNISEKRISKPVLV